MDTIFEIYKTQPNTTHLDLEYKQIDNLAPLIKPISKFNNLHTLNLHGNRLSSLPKDLSSLKTVQALDISNNLISNIKDTLVSLQTIPNLKELYIQIQSKEEEKLILAALPKLVKLNNNVIANKLDQSNLKREALDTFGNKDYGSSHSVELQQDDLEKLAIVYDLLRNRLKSNDGEDEIYQSHFEKHVQTVFSDLQVRTQQLGNQNPLLIQSQILRAKYGLFEISFNLLIEYVQKFDKQLHYCLQVLHDEHAVIFKHQQNIIQRQAESLEKTVQSVTPDNNNEQLNIRIQMLEAQIQEMNSSLSDLQAENSQYLNMIIKYSKTGDKSILPKNSAMMSSHPSVFSNQTDQENSDIPTRQLTLLQLKDTIREIYESKQKYDKKCQDMGIPYETLEQHMYSFLNNKYGLKSLVVEWAASIINGLRKYSEDNDVAVFTKIMKNECEEDFVWVQEQLKSTVKELLRVQLKNKNPYKGQNEIESMVKERIQGEIKEEDAIDILKYMYNERDVDQIHSKIQQHLHSNKPIKNTRDIPTQSPKISSTISFQFFTAIILDFQLKIHERYLHKFNCYFKKVDQDHNGKINEDQLRQLIGLSKVGVSEQQIVRLLKLLDSQSLDQMCYTQIVSVLSSEKLEYAGEQLSYIQIMNIE